MIASPPTPNAPARRRGIVKTLTLDADAVELLYDLAPTRRHLGRLISELIRTETFRREERARTREILETALAHLD